MIVCAGICLSACCSMKFHKYHALGNDYLVLDPADAPGFPNPETVARICHRNFGLGSDGILYGPLPSPEADFGLQIWNPDGSQAEKSGNGLRIFARYLMDCGKVGTEPFKVSTPGGVVACRILDGAQAIEVEMGKVSFDSRVIPVTGPEREVVDEAIELNGHPFRFFAATIGNPHVVIPVDEPNETMARKYGPLVENMTRLFPNRTNVQFMKILSRNAIQIEIWERGAGYTLASGSSSSAAAAVARKMGACDESIDVHCPGGIIRISVRDDFAITMTGPATRVGGYELDSEALS